MRLVLPRHNDRNEERLDCLDRVVSGVRRVKLLPVCLPPCVGKLLASCVVWADRLRDGSNGSGIDTPCQARAVRRDGPGRVTCEQMLVQSLDPVRELSAKSINKASMTARKCVSSLRQECLICVNNSSSLL